MKVIVNDKETQFTGSSLEDLLNEMQIADKKGMAVAVNESVIPKGNWGQQQLRENDSVLIIKPTQGG